MEEFDTSGDGVHGNWLDRFFAKMVDGLLGETGNKDGRVGDMNEWSLFVLKVVIHFTTRVPALQTTTMLACGARNRHGAVALRSPTIRRALSLGRHNLVRHGKLGVRLETDRPPRPNGIILTPRREQARGSPRKGNSSSRRRVKTSRRYRPCTSERSPETLPSP